MTCLYVFDHGLLGLKVYLMSVQSCAIADGIINRCVVAVQLSFPLALCYCRSQEFDIETLVVFGHRSQLPTEARIIEYAKGQHVRRDYNPNIPRISRVCEGLQYAGETLRSAARDREPFGIDEVRRCVKVGKPLRKDQPQPLVPFILSVAHGRQGDGRIGKDMTGCALYELGGQQRSVWPALMQN
jgi:hypothetical protein